ncbi:MAG: glycosyltransferase [Acutalibacteraceae bacterium]|nr:glycosyltransferase [Acutalibacteraceae bacterium]
MKKVLFFIPTLGQGGAEKVLVNLVNNMDKSKYDVTVQVLFDGGVNTQFLNKDVKYKYVFKKILRGHVKLFKLFSPQALYKMFVKDKYDIAVAYLEGITSRIISGCNDEETKTVSWIHIEQTTMENLATAFRSADEAKKCYESFDNVICVSEYVQKDFTGILDFSKHTEVLYNTNETEQIVEKSKEQAPIKTDDEYINICAMGTLCPRKGFDKLARIHKRLLDEGIKQRVYVLGRGAYKSTLEAIIKENNIEDTFLLMGYDTNPYKYLRACDLFVCSSEAEGFSTVVTESLIVGTPVVTTRCSGMEEQLGYNNEYGIVTDNNEQALYEGIKEMLTTEGYLEKYAEKALERGKSFNKEITVRAVEAMLEKL